MEQTHALGRRKTAVARVYLTEGTGNIVINGRPLEDYFKEEALRYVVLQPYTATETLGKFDTKVTLVGGGTKGQRPSVSASHAHFARLTRKHTVLYSRQQDSSPAMLARLSARSLVSLVHAAASSSVNVSYQPVLSHSCGF